ncbi:MAG: dipeptidase [Microvirga sp.]|nr:dipeptidase [Microvirga sp.]
MDVRYTDLKKHPVEKGWHSKVSNPYLFIDGCMQIWPDADFTTLKDCGVTAYCVTAFRPLHPGEAAMDGMADWWRVDRTYPEVRIALTAADIVAAKENGQAALILTAQGGDFLGQNLNRLELFHRMGLRVMLPCYNSRNPLGDGSLEPENAGLSRMGQRWVAECNRLGIVIDLTHTGTKSTMDAMRLSKHPVVFTHSNPRALVENPRNITDDQIRACAATGGVVGITNFGPLHFRDDMTKRPTLEHFFAAIEHVVNLVGVDHVSIGTDMSHGTYPDGDLIRMRNSGSAARYSEFVEVSSRSRLRYVEGFDDYGQIVSVAEAMKRRGFTEDDVKKILGGNLLRVFKTVWGG